MRVCCVICLVYVLQLFLGNVVLVVLRKSVTSKTSHYLDPQCSDVYTNKYEYILLNSSEWWEISNIF